MKYFGIYQKQLYLDETSGWSIFSFLTKDKENKPGQLIYVSGTYSASLNGLPLFVDGQWAQSRKGLIFRAESIKETAVNPYALQEFLSEISNDKLTRKELLAMTRFPGDFFENIFREEYEKYLGEAGLPPVSTLRVLETIRDAVNERKLLDYMLPFNATLGNVRSVLNTFPADPIEALKTNPYEVGAKAHMQFRIVDNVAVKNGIKPASDKRVRALTEHALKIRENAGNTCSDLQSIVTIVRSFIKDSGEDISDAAVSAVLYDQKSIVRDKDVYYSSYLLKDEKTFAREAKRLCDSAIKLPYREELIDVIEADLGVKYSLHQREAFSLLSTTGIKILTGGPGTGKTTTVNGMLLFLEYVAGDVKVINLTKMSLAALSGKASQRMSEATGREASTVHKLLNYQPFGMDVYYKDANDPLEANVIVIDEVSMLDLPLAAKLLSAIKNGSLVLFVGDTDQLQSVGPGAILADMIKSGCIETCQLTEIHRQKGDSIIPKNSRKIIDGDTSLEAAPEFQMIAAQEGQSGSISCSIVTDLISQGVPIDDIQVLSPTRKELGGTAAINKMLQPVMNPQFAGTAEPLKFRKNIFTPGDRIMMQVNNYQKGYYNGDVGEIVSVKGQNEMIIKIGEEEIPLSKDLFEDVDLSYCCTIHKSQGSEYPYTVIVLPSYAAHMMDNSLLYTAVTRAKKCVYIIAEEDALVRSITTQRKDSRMTKLTQRLREEFLLEPVKQAS